MKKNFKYGFIALAALAMTSCSNDELDNVSPQKQTQSPVEFSVYMPQNQVGRGTVVNDNALKEKGFGLMGYYSPKPANKDFAEWNPSGEISYAPGEHEKYLPNFMNNQFVGWNGTNWEYSPLKYWPTMAGDNVTFLAYAPYEKNPSKDAANNIVIPMVADGATNPTITYTLEENNPLKMVDLVTAMYSHTIKKGTKPGSDMNTNEPKVDLQFQHTLSRLAFEAKVSQNMNPESYVNITSFKILGTKSTEKYTQAASKRENVFYKKGVGSFISLSEVESSPNPADKVGHIWAWNKTKREMSSADYSLNKILNMEYAEDMGGYSALGVKVCGEKAVNMFRSKADYLFLLPANQMRIDPSQHSKYNKETGLVTGQYIAFELKYDVVTHDPKLANGYTKVSATKIIRLQGDVAQTQLRQGYAYKYILTIDVDDVKVEAGVAEWGIQNVDQYVSIENPAEVDDYWDWEATK